jgi:hypothetical protein
MLYEQMKSSKKFLKGKCSRHSPRLRWKRQVRQPDAQRDRRKWEETEEELLEGRDRWRGLVVR